MTPIWQTIIALAVIYLFITILMKTTRWVIRIALIALLIGALFLGYTLPSELWKGSQTNDVVTEEITQPEPTTNITIAQNETLNNISSGQDPGKISS